MLETTRDEIRVFLSGELDHHASRPLREQVDKAVERGKPRLLRLDFADLTFMDSSGIGLIMGRYRLMKITGGKLLLTGVTDRIFQMMRMAGLEKLDIGLSPPGGDSGTGC